MYFIDPIKRKITIKGIHLKTNMLLLLFTLKSFLFYKIQKKNTFVKKKIFEYKYNTVQKFEASRIYFSERNCCAGQK